MTAAAITGSASLGREDRWSDIDLALRVAETAEMKSVVADWTERMYRDHGAAHHLDVLRGATLFRVFLLANTLQVDIAFWADSEFGATAPTFRLLFGKANAKPQASPPAASTLIGTGWLYALHVRSSLERGRLWQAEYMLGHMREQVLALACLRHVLPTHEGRGLDDLPEVVTDPLRKTIPRSLAASELRRAFRVTCEMLWREIGRVDGELKARLRGPLEVLMDSSSG